MVVVVEMKDDSEICGVLDDADKDMNLVLSTVRIEGPLVGPSDDGASPA